MIGCMTFMVSELLGPNKVKLQTIIIMNGFMFEAIVILLLFIIIVVVVVVVV